MGKRWIHRAEGGRTLRAMTTAIAAAAVLTLAAVSPALAADTTPPTITRPVVRFAANGSPTSSAAPIRISWVGDDDWSGLASYQFQQSVDGAAFTNVPLSDPLASSVGRTVAISHTYKYRVRAKDVAGNWSGWRDTGTAFRLYLYQQSSVKFAWSGAWYNESVSSALGGSAKYSNYDPATVRFSFFGRAVGWVGMTCSYCGMAPVYVDGVYRGSVNTQWGTQNGQHSGPRIMYQRAWNGGGNHNFELRPERTFLHPRVYVDAAVILVPIA
jgi:hypothetical protein